VDKIWRIDKNNRIRRLTAENAILRRTATALAIQIRALRSVGARDKRHSVVDAAAKAKPK
jgi:hypothetical protein